MLSYKRMYFISMFMLSLSLICYEGIVNAAVVNSIVARVNDHVIMLRDLEIEYRIQNKMYEESTKSRRAILNGMIDDYLVLLEAKKIPQSRHEEKLNNAAAQDSKEFESLFTKRKYDKFLNDLEITRAFIHQRFKERLIINNTLEQKVLPIIKNNGSNLKENVLLKENRKFEFSKDSKRYISKLRKKSSRLMINDFISEDAIPVVE